MNFEDACLTVTNGWWFPFSVFYWVYILFGFILFILFDREKGVDCLSMYHTVLEVGEGCYD